MSISKSLLRAARLQERIDELRRELSDLLDRARAEVDATSREETETSVRRGSRAKLKRGRGEREGAGFRHLERSVRLDGSSKEPSKRGKPIRRRGPSPLAGLKRPASPTGPLAPAVVKVLQAKKQPMSVRDILSGLLANGYKFNSSEPKKNLAARIYRLKGVKQVAAGLFVPE